MGTPTYDKIIAARIAKKKMSNMSTNGLAIGNNHKKATYSLV